MLQVDAYYETTEPSTTGRKSATSTTKPLYATERVAAVKTLLACNDKPNSTISESLSPCNS